MSKDNIFLGELLDSDIQNQNTSDNCYSSISESFHTLLEYVPFEKPGEESTHFRRRYTIHLPLNEVNQLPDVREKEVKCKEEY